mgnify:CR=1 FL=1
MSGDADKLIDKRNSQVLHDAFEGKKKHIEIFPGSHNTKRPLMVVQKIMKMLGDYVRELPKNEKVQNKSKESISKVLIEVSTTE